MNGDATIFRDFAGETRRFRVAIGELEKIQDDTGAGPFVVIQALAQIVSVLQAGVEAKSAALAIYAHGLGSARVAFVRSPLVHGLIGGGMAPEETFRLIRRTFDIRPVQSMTEYASLALAVITGAVEGPEDDNPAGESAGAGASAPAPRKRRSRKAGSASA